MSCEAEDAGGLSPGKDDNDAGRKIDRKDVLLLEWFDYIVAARGCKRNVRIINLTEE